MRAFIVILLLLTSLFGDHEDEIEFFEAHLPKDMSCLHLSKDQKEKIKQILLKNNENIKSLKRKKTLLSDRVKKRFVENNFTKEYYYNEIIELQKEHVRIESELLYNLYKELTFKQRKIFVNYLEEWDIE